jgi:hypothetical protein
MLRIVTSSIIRRRSGVICLLISELLSDRLHEHAILTDPARDAMSTRDYR